jgi:hypothetical protein
MLIERFRDIMPATPGYAPEAQFHYEKMSLQIYSCIWIALCESPQEEEQSFNFQWVIRVEFRKDELAQHLRIEVFQLFMFRKLTLQTFLIPLLLLASMAWHGEAKASEITLTWTDNSGNEDGFKIERKTTTSGTFAQISMEGAGMTTYTDPGLAVDTTYCYRVRAFNTNGDSTYTNEACTTTRQGASSFVFTDDPLTSQFTPVKAVHFTELRQAINDLRFRNGLPLFNFTDPILTPGVTPIKADHLRDLRTALNAVFGALNQPSPPFTDPAIVPRNTVIKRIHITELQSAVSDADVITLTVNAARSATGAVTSSPVGFNCDTGCSDTDGDGISDDLEVSQGSDPLDPGSFPLESGQVLVNDTWRRVEFGAPFVDPVVVAKPLSFNESDPAVVRIQNVNSTGFDIRVQEWSYLDGWHADEVVGYVVMEHGSYTLADGTLIEAGSFETDMTGSYDLLPFNMPFNTAPVVLAAASTFNGPDPVSTRVHNIDTQGFEFGMQEEENFLPEHPIETISYIAWEPSAGTFNGLTFEVNTAQNVTDAWTHIQFGVPFTASPVFLASIWTSNDVDTATLRWQNKDFSGVEVKVEEERSLDNETSHATEVVGYIAIGLE